MDRSISSNVNGGYSGGQVTHLFQILSHSFKAVNSPVICAEADNIELVQ